MIRDGTTVILGQWRNSYASPSLCEIACSLNENVERLAFSCVWTMNMDGTLNDNTGVGESIFYGRSVIKSYARLDNATAQNIIDNKVAIGEAHADESFCSKRRQPTGGHTIDEVADDVRLMHKVAMARRKLRFENGALALNGIKLAFTLDEDGETSQLCAPYSNRLIEEYMLLANYLVAQRLITHATCPRTSTTPQPRCTDRCCRSWRFRRRATPLISTRQDLHLRQSMAILVSIISVAIIGIVCAASNLNLEDIFLIFGDPKEVRVHSPKATTMTPRQTSAVAAGAAD